MLTTLLALMLPTLPAQSALAPEPLRRLPQAVASFGAATIGDTLYVLGGHVGTTHEHSRDNLCEAFVAVELPDGRTRTLPGGRALQGLALVAHHGALVRVGGLSARNAPGEEEDLWSVDEVARYEPASESWSALPSLPQPRSSHDAVLAGEHLIVGGGWSMAGKERRFCEEVLTLDLAAPESGWQALPQPFRRRALSLASDGERVFFVGGLDELGLTSEEVDVLTLGSRSWSKAPALPSSGFGSSAWCLDGSLYVLLADGMLLRLDESGEAPSWQRLGRIAFPRMFARLLPAGDGALLVVGGAQKGGHVPWIERVQPLEQGLAPSLQTFALELASSSRQRAGFLAHGGALYFLGGNKHTEAHHFEAQDFSAEAFRVRPGCALVERLPDLPSARQSMALVLAPDGRSAWMLGGFRHDGEAERSSAEISSLDLESGRISPLAERLPRPLTQFGCALVDGRPCLFGGLDYDPQRLEPFEHQAAVVPLELESALAVEASVQLDEPRVASARELPPMPRTRRAFAGALLDGRYVAVGGLREDFELVEECVALELASGRWEDFPAPRAARVSAELVALGGKLYLVGGSSRGPEGELRPDPSIEVFDPAHGARGSWSVLLEEQPLPPSNLYAAAFGDTLLLASAMRTPGVLELALLRPPDGASAQAR